MEFIIYIALGAVAFWIGWHARGIVILANLARDPEKMIGILEKIKDINQEEEHEQHTTLEGIELAIERVQDEFYAYNKKDGRFVAQGTSLESVLKSASDRFPGTKFFGKTSAENSTK